MALSIIKFVKLKPIEFAKIFRTISLTYKISAQYFLPFIGYKRRIKYSTQVGFAESKKTAEDRANIGSTVIGVPIVDQ